MSSNNDCPTDASGPHSPDDSRRRVGKACDRCRLKKSKCDGANPCSRCRDDNSICVFGEKKKTLDKIYPKGYVEMLEEQQAQLVSGLQESYRRLNAAGKWHAPQLDEAQHGHILTHDILVALDVLSIRSDAAGAFEEDLSRLQQRIGDDKASSSAAQSSTSAPSVGQKPAKRTKRTHVVEPLIAPSIPRKPSATADDLDGSMKSSGAASPSQGIASSMTRFTVQPPHSDASTSYMFTFGEDQAQSDDLLAQHWSWKATPPSTSAALEPVFSYPRQHASAFDTNDASAAIFGDRFSSIFDQCIDDDETGDMSMHASRQQQDAGRW